MMTREDMLRELELLPVWRLRNPLAMQIELVQEVSMSEISVNETSVQDAESVLMPSLSAAAEVLVVDSSAATLPETVPQLFRHVSSDDGNWLFVLKNQALLADEALLLCNIFMAMGIRANPVEANTVSDHLSQAGQAKLVVAMGEHVAQHLLQSTEILANLRGTVHDLQAVALVVSYDLAHLLQVVADKEKSWDDLCLAMQTMRRLKSVS